MKQVCCILLALCMLPAFSGCAETEPSTETGAAGIAASEAAAETEEAEKDAQAGVELGYSTVEAAVDAYITGVGEGDLEKALSACAVESYGKGCDIRSYTDELGYYDLSANPAPTEYEAYAELNTIIQYGRLANQTRVFYEYLSGGGVQPEGMKGGVWERAEGGSDDLDDYFKRIDPANLSGLSVAEVLAPSVIRDGDEEVSQALELDARAAGAQEATQVVVLLELEGRKAVCSFQMLRYGDQWKIYSHGAPSVKMVDTGAAAFISDEELEEFRSVILEGGAS